jgi:hypothetical protein
MPRIASGRVTGADFPQMPEAPRRSDGETNHYVDRRHRAATNARNLHSAFLEIERKDHAMLESLSAGYEEDNEKYVGFVAALSLKRHFLSVGLQKPSECHYESSMRILLCEIETPILLRSELRSCGANPILTGSMLPRPKKSASVRPWSTRCASGLPI